MHEDTVHNCLLGCCEEPDSLSHYVQCPHIFAMMRYFLQDCSADPLVRLGLISPSISCLKVVCCMFSAYHALKGKVRAGIIAAPGDNSSETFHNTGSSIRCCWSVFAQSFAAEAGEHAVAHRAFSLPKFMFFIASGGVLPDTGSPAHASNYNSPVHHLTRL